jgi:hypothetical protein
MAVLQRLQTAARKLTNRPVKLKEYPMSEKDLRNEITAGEVEPLLPIEKKLIGWSLGIGLTLLVILIGLNHFVPIKI